MKLQGHIVICGWNEKALRIIKELHAPVVTDKRPIVVISEAPGPMPAGEEFNDVYAIQGDPASDSILRRAGVDSADCAIILADKAEADFADARSILIALAIESINSEVHTCVEVVNSKNISHFSRTSVDETVCVSELSEKLLAQAAMNHGISAFYTELLTFQEEGNEVYHVEMPEEYVGQSFGALFMALLDQRVILLGAQRAGRPRLNPGKSFTLEAGDSLWVIAFSKPDLCSP